MRAEKNLRKSHLSAFSSHLNTRIVILGNGKWESPGALKSSLKKDDFIMACDGAYRKAGKNGVRVDLVIGDLDSVSRKEIPKTVQVMAYPAEKDETDGELALQYALSRKPEKILWYSPLGNRWDHSLANLFCLEQAAREEIPVVLVQGKWNIFLVLKSCLIEGEEGDRVSLIPFSEGVNGISTTGLKYPLKVESLSRSRTRGISNVLTSKKARVELKSGWLLVLHERN